MPWTFKIGRAVIFKLGLLICVVALIAGCSSTEERAQKLYDAGQYEEVLRLYTSDTMRAKVNPHTSLAPALFNTLLHSFIVAPLIQKSSTITTLAGQIVFSLH